MENLKKYDGVITINCNFGNNVVIGEHSFLRNSILHDYVQINRRNILDNSIIGNCSYTGSNSILKNVCCGKYCSISWNVSATGTLHDYKNISSHPFPFLNQFGFVEKNQPLEHKDINIGNDVWIGANACVLAGITIGDGAIIGAGCVVTKDIPPYAIVVGNPGKILKYRFNEEIMHLLLMSKWWDLPTSIIKENLGLFQGNVTKETAQKIMDLTKEYQGITG